MKTCEKNVDLGSTLVLRVILGLQVIRLNMD